MQQLKKPKTERKELEDAIAHLKEKKVKSPVLRMLEKQLEDLEKKELQRKPSQKRKSVNLEHVYKSKSGEELYGVTVKDGKRSHGHYHGETAVVGLNGVQKVPYRLPEIIKTDRVFICENEQIADRIHDVALVGTTSIDGFNGFDSLLGKWLEGKKVYILHEEGQSTDEIRNLRLILLPIAHTLTVSSLPQAVYSKLENGELNQDQVLKHTKGSGDHMEQRKSLNISRSDAGNGERFKKLFGDVVRFVKDQQRWILWNDVRWEFDITGEISTKAKKVPDMIWDEVCQTPPGRLQNQLEKWHIQSMSNYRQDQMLKHVSHDETIRIISDDLDRDPLLIGLKNGVYNLKDGSFRESNRSDLITRMGGIAYNPKAESKEWARYLEKVTAINGYSKEEHSDFARYLRAIAVYLMTADVRIEKFFYFYGPGGSGKTTFTETMSSILGEYAALLPAESLTDENQHPTDLAGIVGTRMILTQEIPANRWLNEGKFKQITGEGRIKARFMGKDFFEYQRTYKSLGSGNNHVNLRSTNNEIRRRFEVIPFPQIIKNPDPSLKQRIRLQYPGIFNDIVSGFDFQSILSQLRRPPRIVVDATNRYFRIHDSLGDFISEYCILTDKVSIGKTELYHAYFHFMKMNGYTPVGMNHFRESIQRKSDEKNMNLSEFRVGAGTRWKGIALKTKFQKQSAKGVFSEFFLSGSK